MQDVEIKDIDFEIAAIVHDGVISPEPGRLIGTVSPVAVGPRHRG